MEVCNQNISLEMPNIKAATKTVEFLKAIVNAYAVNHTKFSERTVAHAVADLIALCVLMLVSRGSQLLLYCDLFLLLDVV